MGAKINEKFRQVGELLEAQPCRSVRTASPPRILESLFSSCSSSNSEAEKA